MHLIPNLNLSERIRKAAASKANFRTFLSLNFFNIRSKNSVKDLRVTKYVKENRFEGVWGELELKKKLPETITDKILETNSSFHVKQCTTGKV